MGLKVVEAPQEGWTPNYRGKTRRGREIRGAAARGGSQGGGLKEKRGHEDLGIDEAAER